VPEPERLGRYTLGDKIGEGGMGVVFRAQIDGAEGFSKPVAIKTIHAALARDPGIREMLVTEAQTAQRLHHGNIVQIIDVGLADKAPYLVIEYVDGMSLSELTHARGALPVADALYIAESVASALAYAHGLTDKAGRPDGVVHRDVTPRNILMSRDGVVKLADFGIAKALAAPSYTVPGTFKGSLGYLAPEQARGAAVDARADQFAFGVVLHEMLSGKNPIASRDVESYYAMLDRGVPALADTPPIDAALVAIVARATEIDPAARYSTMDELRAELEAWRVDHKIRTSNESLRETMRMVVGQDTTIPTGRVLGEVLAGRLGSQTVATKQQRPRARVAMRQRWQWPMLALGVVGVGAIAYVVATSSGRVGSVPVDAAPSPERRVAVDGATPDATIEPASDAASDAMVAVRVPRRVGRLRVNVVPWAMVTLDNLSLGRTPVNSEVSAGPHRLVLHNPDTGDRVEKSIRIEADRELEVTSW
jgi:serine/threonine-protein kinase